MARHARRGSHRRWRARVAVAAIAAPLFLAAAHSPAAATGKALSLGEVSSRVYRSDVDLAATLRAAIEEEIGALDTSAVPATKAAILSVSLVRMDRDAGAKDPSLTCVVSVAMRSARGGSMFAMLEGRARLSLGTKVTAFDERQVVRAAVRSALLRVPDALR